MEREKSDVEAFAAVAAHDLLTSVVMIDAHAVYLLKDMSAARLPAALCGVVAGEVALPAALARRLIEEFRAGEARHRGRRRFMPGRRRVQAERPARTWEVFVLISEDRWSTSSRNGSASRRSRSGGKSPRRCTSSMSRTGPAPCSDESATGWPEGPPG